MLCRRERVKLLLKTYIDAYSPGRGAGDVRSTFGSRLPATAYFQEKGSYAELGRCVQRLRVEYPKIHRHTLTVYAPDLLAEACDFRGVPHPRKQLSEKGLDLITSWMPANVYVPAEVVENGGYSPGEAKAAGKPKPRVAA